MLKIMCALVMTFDQKNSLFSRLPYNKTSCLHILHLLFKEVNNVVFIPDFQLKLHMETPPPTPNKNKSYIHTMYCGIIIVRRG